MRTKPLPEAYAYGIDIGKKVFHVVAVNREGAVIQRAKFARETLHSFFDLAAGFGNSRTSISVNPGHAFR